MINTGVLSGLRVVEAAAFVAAPLGGMTLAQMGADVIRIDTLAGGLDYRRWPVAPDGTSLFWTGLNKAKRSVALDLSSEEGRDIAMALITAPGPDAGLFMTNFPPRGWLDYEKLCARRPDLIQLSLQGDRHGGSAVDYTVNPRLGLPLMTGPQDSAEPVNHVLPAWDLIAGQMAATGLLAAERHRSRTGQGQHIRLALQDVGLAVMAHLGFIAEAQLGQPRQRHGNDLFGALGKDFQCADGVRIMIVGLTRKQWRAICKALDMDNVMDALAEELGLDFSQEGDRFRARDAISGYMQDWIGKRSSTDVIKALEQCGVCWGPYQTIEELVANDPECSVANPMFSEIEQHGVGRVLAPAIPLDFGHTGRIPAAPAPRLGEHTEDVLDSVLGIGGKEFGRLLERGVVGVADR